MASASTAAAPAVAIAADSYVLVLGIDKGVEALTGKSATEWVSDAVVNVGEVVVDGDVKLGRAVAAKTCQAGEFVINTAVKAGEAVVGKAKDCYNAVANWLDSIF